MGVVQGCTNMSCHVCGMWIEILVKLVVVELGLVSCHVCGMWIEITTFDALANQVRIVMPRMWHVD